MITYSPAQRKDLAIREANRAAQDLAYVVRANRMFLATTGVLRPCGEPFNAAEIAEIERVIAADEAALARAEDRLAAARALDVSQIEPFVTR
jgi:hypothetical protein